MRYQGEVLETITAKEAKEIAKGKELPKFNKSIDLLIEGLYCYQLVNIGNGWYNIEGFKMDMRSK